MPSPIGHGVAGLTVHLLTSRDRAELTSARHAAVSVGAALAPDLDLLLRFVDGRNHHQGASRPGPRLAARRVRRPRDGLGPPWAPAVAAGAGLGEPPPARLPWRRHPSPDRVPLCGHSHLAISRHPGHFSWTSGVHWTGTMIRHDTVVVTWEMVVTLPILLITWWWRRREG